MEIVHGDVDIDFAAGCFDAKNHGLGIHAARETFFVHVDFGRKDLETEALVVEQRDGIADDHVGELTDSFANNLLAFREFRTGKLAGDTHGDFSRSGRSDVSVERTISQSKSR